MSDLDLQAWSIANWSRIPEADRKRCVDHLRPWLMATDDGVAELARWRRQVKKGRVIGEGDSWFHFGTGMAIRNRLRDVLKDDQLPSIGTGGTQGNWDDFYIGAIHALVTESEKPVAASPTNADVELAYKNGRADGARLTLERAYTAMLAHGITSSMAASVIEKIDVGA